MPLSRRCHMHATILAGWRKREGLIGRINARANSEHALRAFARSVCALVAQLVAEKCAVENMVLSYTCHYGTPRARTERTCGERECTHRGARMATWCSGACVALSCSCVCTRACARAGACVMGCTCHGERVTLIKLSLSLSRSARQCAPVHCLCIGTCIHGRAHACECE